MEDRIREHREANGIAVIVTNDYTTCPGLDNLPGANIDGQNLTAAFKTLKFDVRSSQNIDKARLYHIVHEISTLDYQSYPRIIFIFAGHGCEGGMLYMQDGTKVMLWETIVEPLLPKNAKNIATIPKAFLFDACRGLETTKTVLVPRSSEVKKTLPRGGDVIDMTKVPEDANFLLAYSTMPNHKAYERKDKGGIWFSTLVDLIQKQVRLYSLDDLLTEVNKSMAANMKGLDFQQPEKFSRLHEVLCLDPRASVPGNPSSVNPPRRIAAVFPSGIHNTAQQPGSTTIPFVQLLARYTKQYGLHEEYIDKEIYNEEYQHVYYSSGVRIVGGHGEILLENHGTNMYVSLDSAREEAAKIAYQSLLEQPPTGQNVLPSSSNERSEARTDGQSVRQLDTSKSLAPEPFKNSRDRLNHYFQKNGLNPRYDYVEDYSSGQQPIFKCTIQYSVNGKIIRRDSGRFFPRKADAKENAARNVLQNMEADTQPCGGSGGAGATVGVSWKSLLKEHYDKRGHPNMVLNYDTMQNGSGFLSKVFVPELRGKVKAEARKKLNRVQQKKLPNMVGYKNESSCQSQASGAEWVRIQQGCTAAVIAQQNQQGFFRNQLNTYQQKEIITRYEFKEYSSPPTNQFLFCVEVHMVNSPPFTVHSSLEPTKAAAKESAAEKACGQIEMWNSHQGRGTSNSVSTSKKKTSQKKTWKSKLKEHFDAEMRGKVVEIKYDTKMDGSSGFRSTVFCPKVGSVTGEKRSSKQDAEHSAAQKALQLLQS